MCSSDHDELLIIFMQLSATLVENRFSVVWEPGQYTTLAPWYPLDGRLGLTRPNHRLATWARKESSGYLSCRGLWVNWRREPVLARVFEVRVACSLYGRTRRSRTGHAWIPGWVVLHNRVYLLSTRSILGSEETNCSSIFKLVYTP